MLPFSVVAQQRAVPESREQIQLSFAPLVQHTASAVVNIYAIKRVKVPQSPFMSDPLMERFFGQDPIFSRGFGGRTREQLSNSLGSGVIVREDGLIITNKHVIADADKIRVVLNDKQEFDADIVMTDPRTDLALLKVKAPDTTFAALPFGHIDSLQVGDMVLAIGNPFGVGQTVTSGIVSALARTTVGISDFEFFIQTDAAINPGNSGGALINMAGELVGINTAIYSKTGTSAGIGFATPAIMAQLLLNSYEQGSKTVTRPWLGITTQNLTKDIAKSQGLRAPKGVIVREVYPKSPADVAGIHVGDVLTHMEDQEVADQASLRFRIATSPLGTEVKLQLLRDGKPYSASVRMEPPAENPPRQTTKLDGNHPLGGVIIANLSPALVEELGVDESRGVVVLDVDRQYSGSRFIQPMDMIRMVNGVKIQDVAQLVRILQDVGQKGWEIQIQRGGKMLNVTLR